MTQSLDAIMAGRDASASADTENTTERTETAQRDRDDQGRFAGRREQEKPDTSAGQTGTQQADRQQTEGAAETPQQQAAKPQTGQVPQQALHAERQARRALEREVGEMRQMLQRLQPQAQQQPQKPADPLFEFVSDPTAFLQQQVTPFQQQMIEVREQVQELAATQAHGADKVAAAKRAVEELRDAGDPRLSVLWGRIQQAANPYDELVRWHAEQARLTQFGDDPEAYINAEVERRLAERGQQQQQPAGAGQQQIPPSFAGARNGAPRQAADHHGGPRPLSEIMGR